MPGRLVRLVAGLVLCGAGIALMVRADLGLAPWSVLDQGLAERTGLPIGTLSIITGAIVLTMWVPLRQRPGIGTVANVILIGLTIDAVLAVLDAPGSMAGRVAFMVLGVAMWGPGSGFYIGAGLGPGPRDGLMTGLHAKGVGSIRVVRTALEVTVLTVGWLLGGSGRTCSTSSACSGSPHGTPPRRRRQHRSKSRSQRPALPPSTQPRLRASPGCAEPEGPAHRR
jgi:uncharacterized membrane protein YczE